LKKFSKGGSKYYTCDICDRLVYTRIALFLEDSFCNKCRSSVPKHIPKEQKDKYLKERKKNVKYKKEI